MLRPCGFEQAIDKKLVLYKSNYVILEIESLVFINAFIKVTHIIQKTFILGDPIDIADELRSKYGVKIYAVGIGKSINKRELKLLVGQRNKNHVFQLEKFDDFQEIIEKLTHKGMKSKV